MDEAVGSALEAKIRGSGVLYEQLIEEIRTCHDLDQLLKLFSSLAENAALLAANHSLFSELLSMLFQFDWGGNNERVALGFESILTSLVSANVGFLEPIFDLLARNLLPPPLEAFNEPPQEDVVAETGETTTKPEQKEGAMQEIETLMKFRSACIHRAFKAILRLAPLGCTQLLPVLIHHFPHRLRESHIQKHYVSQILTVATYVPVLRDKILALVIEKMVLIDMEIRTDELEPTTQQVDQRTLAPEEPADAGDVSSTDDEDKQPAKEPVEVVVEPISREVQRVRDLAETLDGLLIIVMDYVDQECSRGKRHSRLFFKLLLNVFDRFVLPTKRCKFVQFVMFYVCRMRAEYVDQFIDRLLRVALSEDSPRDKRTSAASYLGSFLARATYVRRDSMQSALLHVDKWLTGYVESYVTYVENQRKLGIRYDDPVTHTPFYSVCLASMYSVLFKGAELEKSFLNDLNWVTIANSELQPFKYVSRDVVDEFHKFAGEHGIDIAHSTYEVDSSGSSSSTRSSKQVHEPHDTSSSKSKTESTKASTEPSSDNKSDEVHTAVQMDFHYPFDPLLLQASSVRVEELYQYWFGTDDDHYLDTDEDSDVQASDDESEDEEPAEFSKEHIERLQRSASPLPPAIVIPHVKRAAHMLGALGAADTGDDVSSYWGFGFTHDDGMQQHGTSSPMLAPASRLRKRGSCMIAQSPLSAASNSFGGFSPRMEAVELPANLGIQDAEDLETMSQGSW